MKKIIFVCARPSATIALRRSVTERSFATSHIALTTRVSGGAFAPVANSWGVVMTIWAEQLPVTGTGALMLKIGTALLITFAAAVALLHAELYFSAPLITENFMSIL